MRYVVVYSSRSESELTQQIRYLRACGTPDEVLDAWLGRLFDAVESLADWPERGPVDSIWSDATGEVIRRLAFEEYVAFYRVDHGAQAVELLTIQHGARDAPPPG